MRIATFNINNVNRRLPNLLRWLAASAPDVVCLQELKCAHGDFPIDAIRKAGYHAVWKGERSWNGVAILARKREPILIRDVLPGNTDDKQSRYIEAAVEGIAVASIYLPNGNPQPGPKFKYKLEWFDRLVDHAAELLAQDVPAVLAGDYNVVPTDFDIYATRSYKDNALLQPAPRAAYAKLLGGRLDGRVEDAPSGRSDVHLLELSEEPVATGCGPQAGPPPPEPCGRAAVEGRRRRPGHPWRARSERPCPVMDRTRGRGKAGAKATGAVTPA